MPHISLGPELPQRKFRVSRVTPDATVKVFYREFELKRSVELAQGMIPVIAQVMDELYLSPERYALFSGVETDFDFRLCFRSSVNSGVFFCGSVPEGSRYLFTSDNAVLECQSSPSALNLSRKALESDYEPVVSDSLPEYNDLLLNIRDALTEAELLGGLSGADYFDEPGFDLRIIVDRIGPGAKTVFRLSLVSPATDSNVLAPITTN